MPEATVRLHTHLFSAFILEILPKRISRSPLSSRQNATLLPHNTSSTLTTTASSPRLQSILSEQLPGTIHQATHLQHAPCASFTRFPSRFSDIPLAVCSTHILTSPIQLQHKITSIQPRRHPPPQAQAQRNPLRQNIRNVPLSNPRRLRSSSQRSARLLRSHKLARPLHPRSSRPRPRALRYTRGYNTIPCARHQPTD